MVVTNSFLKAVQFKFQGSFDQIHAILSLNSAVTIALHNKRARHL